MTRLRARIGWSAILLLGGLTIAAQSDVAQAAPNCQGPVTTPCVVQAGLVVEPIIQNVQGDIPTNFDFAPDGKIFVADKVGRILVYSGRGAAGGSAQVVVDIQNEVHSYWDRGILGIAVDPDYANSPYVYFLYTYNRDPKSGASAPQWPAQGCNDPPGGGGSGPTTGDGCVVSARIGRIRVNPATGLAAGAKETIFDSSSNGGWCEQFPSHSIGTLMFGPDGTLYAGAGDGASFDTADYGQFGGQRSGTPIPVNPCGDPADNGSGGRGNALSLPSSQGGSLRSQSVRSQVADGYQPYDGSIIRINKDGSVPGDNPLVGTSTAHGNSNPIVAYGLRNPFRFNFKPGIQQLWVGDVGYNSVEEISHAAVGGTNDGITAVPNFGWPCYEGDQPNTDFLGRSHLCDQGLGTSIANVPSPLISPAVAWRHSTDYAVDQGCKPVSSSPGSSSTGGSFVTATDWPATLDGAYVFGDYGRQCLWALTASQQTNNTTSLTSAVPIASGLAPISIRTWETGPNRRGDGAIYILDAGDLGPGHQTIWRVGTPSSPLARFSMTATSGNPPLAEQFDASNSFVLQGSVARYEWDLDGDGTYEVNSTNASARFQSRTYTNIGPVDVKLRITDGQGRTDTEVQRIMVGSPPVIDGFVTDIGPNGALEGDTVQYTIDATDPNGSPLTFSIVDKMRHCDLKGGTSCHLHRGVVGSLPSTASGSFRVPGHAGYSFLEFDVTATNAAGLSATRTFQLPANWLTLKVDTFPPGMNVARDGSAITAPYTGTQIGSPGTTVSADPVQVKGGVTHLFTGWADAPQIGPSRTIAPAAGDVSLIAQFAAVDGLTSITPKRVLDTRDGTGAPAGIVAATGVVSLDLRAAGLPTDATAALLNVTVTDGTDPGFVTVYPCTQPRPTASNLNYTKGKTAANLVQVAVDPGGTVCLYAHGATHLVADLSGWFQPTGKSFTPVSPTRVLDTRAGTGAPAGAVAAGSVLTLDLSSAPAGSTSAVLNVTSTEATGPGFVTVYPCGGDLPLASNLNVGTGDTRPNQVVVGLGTGNTVCLFVHSTMHLVADLMGWYGDSGQKVATQAPERVLDTRDGTGGTRAGFFGTVVLDLSAQAPAGATGVMLNVTGVEPAFATYVTAYPCDATPPLASNLNLPAGDIRPNLVAVPLSADKKVCLFTQTPVDLVADVAGWSVAG